MSTASKSSKTTYTAWLLLALLLPLGAHRLYLGVRGWWYWPLGFATAIWAEVVGVYSLAALIQLGGLVLWIHDTAHMAGWLAARDERTTTY